MRGAEARLQTMFQAMPDYSSSSSVSSSSLCDDLPFSSVLSSLWPMDDLLDQSFPDPFLGYTGDSGTQLTGSYLAASEGPSFLPQTAFPQYQFTQEGQGGAVGVNLADIDRLPNVMELHGGHELAGPHGQCVVDSTLEELDKARRKQLKAEQRKQRNKEAARRSNLNKKILRDQLEKRSVELWEENLQLHQDIRELNNKLRHFHQLRKAMHHVCQRPPGMTTFR